MGFEQLFNSELDFVGISRDIQSDLLFAEVSNGYSVGFDILATDLTYVPIDTTAMSLCFLYVLADFSVIRAAFLAG